MALFGRKKTTVGLDIGSGLIKVAVVDHSKSQPELVRVAITPLLWRLDYYGIVMPKQAAPLLKYAERLFARPAFSEALTSAERGMRK